MEYKVEDLIFYNMKTSIKHISNFRITTGKCKIYEIEKQLTVNEKVKFIDDLKDGIASYLLNIFSKWESEKDSLPKDNYDYVKTVSKKAWIKRNDERKIIDIDYKIGKYWLFGTEFKDMSTTCPSTEYSYQMAYTGGNIIDQWFHDLCDLLFREEEKYFKDHDTFQIKLSKLKELGNKHNIVFGSMELNDIVWNRKSDVSEHRIDEYISAYERLYQFIDQIGNELNQKSNEGTE